MNENKFTSLRSFVEHIQRPITANEIPANERYLRNERLKHRPIIYVETPIIKLLPHGLAEIPLQLRFECEKTFAEKIKVIASMGKSSYCNSNSFLTKLPSHIRNENRYEIKYYEYVELLLHFDTYKEYGDMELVMPTIDRMTWIQQ